MFIFIAVLVFIVVFILFSPLKIKIYGESDAVSLNSEIVFMLYNFVVYSFKPGESNKENQERQAKKYSVFQNRKKFYKCLDKYNVNNLELRAIIGLDDAAATAVSTGVLYSLFSGVYVFVRNFVNVDNVVFDVTPDFYKTCFNFKFLCIIEVKVVNIIIDVLRIWIDSFYVGHFEEHKTVKGRV